MLSLYSTRRVGVDNAIYFVLKPFQISFSPKHVLNKPLTRTPNVPPLKIKSMWNIGRTICVTCTFHLRWT